MSNGLRLALAAIVLSLGGTLMYLVAGDSGESHTASGPIVARLRSLFVPRGTASRPLAPVADRTPTRTSLATRSEFVEPVTESATRAPRLLPALTRPRHAVAPVAVEASPSALTDDAPDLVTVRPANSESATSAIELAAFTSTPQSAMKSGEKIKELVVKNQDITTVLELLSLQGQRNIVASRNVKGPLSISLYNTNVDDALAAILKMQGLVARQEGDYFRVYTPEDLQEAESQGGRIEIRIYKPRYISATDLIGILTVHLSQRGKISSTKPNQVGIAASADNAGGDSLSVDDAIVVQDVESVLATIESIIEQVDVRPPQVLIEATVLRVELNDSNQMGVNFALFGKSALTVSGQGGVLNDIGGFKKGLLVDQGRISDGFLAGDNGLKFGVIQNDLTAFVKLLETVGHTTLVASPKVLALNKQRADIIIGAQLGYRTVTTTDTAAIESIQFLEVGTQLRVRPFVQSNGTIRLELHPEKSSGQVSETTGLPEKKTTQVTTNLAVPSGATVVIGGLIEEEQQRSVQQVPFLGSLPWVGNLFRDETTTTRRQEIIVLITPRIVNEDEWARDGQAEMDTFQHRRDSVERSMPPYTRVALARKYYEKACYYRGHGDLETACQMADLALHYDPTDPAIIKLRNEVHATPDESVATPSDMPIEAREPAKRPRATTWRDRRDKLFR